MQICREQLQLNFAFRSTNACTAYIHQVVSHPRIHNHTTVHVIVCTLKHRPVSACMQVRIRTRVCTNTCGCRLRCEDEPAAGLCAYRDIACIYVGTHKVGCAGLDSLAVNNTQSTDSNNSPPSRDTTLVCVRVCRLSAIFENCDDFAAAFSHSVIFSTPPTASPFTKPGRPFPPCLWLLLTSFENLPSLRPVVLCCPSAIAPPQKPRGWQGRESIHQLMAAVARLAVFPAAVPLPVFSR